MNDANKKRYFNILKEVQKLDDGIMAELVALKDKPSNEAVKLAMEYAQVTSAKVILESVL